MHKFAYIPVSESFSIAKIIHPPDRWGISRSWLNRMIITQVHLVLGTIKGHSKMCSFVTQHNATGVSSFEIALTWWLQECPPELPLSASNVVLEFGSMSNRPHKRRQRVTTSAQDLHIRLLHLWDRLRPAIRTADETVGLHKKNFCTNCQKPSQGSSSACSFVFTRVLAWLQLGVVTDFSGQMLTFDGHWHAGEVSSL
jgi:hypothetical protein